MKFIWTDYSELTLDEIIDYIENKFGLLVSEKYYSDSLETVDDIKINPELFPIYQEITAVRKAVINKKQYCTTKFKSKMSICLHFMMLEKELINYKNDNPNHFRKP